MKKTVRVVSALVLLIALLMGGCKAQEEIAEETVLSNDVYSVVKKGDQFTMRVTDEAILQLAENIHVYYSPTYSTLEEMRTAIRECRFTESDYIAIAYFARKNDGEIPLFDLENLKEPTLPGNSEYTSVTWGGARYYFHYDNENLTGTVYVINKESFDQQVAEEFFGYFDEEDDVITKTEEDQVRGGTMYYYTRGRYTQTKSKVYMATFTQGTKTVYVQETYYNTSNNYPNWIEMWVVDGDDYFSVLLEGYDVAMTESWYLSFGLTPYEGGTTEP